jgi:hypothetical protein
MSTICMVHSPQIFCAMSWVWEHFKKNGSKAVCQFKDGNGILCGAQLDYGKNTSSLSYHLVNKHGLAKGAPSKKQRLITSNSTGVFGFPWICSVFFC